MAQFHSIVLVPNNVCVRTEHQSLEMSVNKQLLASKAAWGVLLRSMSTMKAGTTFRMSEHVHSSDLDVLEKIASARGCCRRFDSHKPVPDDILTKVLSITQVSWGSLSSAARIRSR